MKYVVLAVVCAFGGFVAAWISFEHMISDGGTHSSPSLITITSSPEQPPRPAYRSATTPTFEDIEQSNSVFEQQYMAWQLASATDIPGLRSLIDKCMGKSDPLYNRNIAAIFLERYIALDPQGAMGFVSGNATMDPLYFIGDVITSWVRYDPRKAVDALKAIANRSIRMRVAAMLLADPEFAQSALADEVKAELGPMGERLLQQIKSRNADPQDLFRQAMLVQGPERRFKLATAISRWAAKDPEAALARIALLSDPSERKMMLDVAIRQYSNINPKAALDWLQDNRPSDADLQKQVLLSWVKVDLNDALPLVEDFARRTGQTDVYNTMVGFWVRQDPDKAIAWADSLDDSQKSSVYRTLAYNYIQSHPRAGLNWVVGLGAQYDDIKMSALRSINGENASVAQQILSNTSDPVARSALFMGLAQYKASRDPKAALNWLSGYQSSQHYPDAYITIMSRYAARDPTDAAQQLLDAPLPDEATRKAAFAIASTWYQQDAGAATRWVASLPTSAAGVGAIQGIATLLANKDPERALSLVASLPESDRSNVARSVGFIVVGKNPAEAEDVITRLGLGPMAAEQIRQLARSQKADTPNM